MATRWVPALLATLLLAGCASAPTPSTTTASVVTNARDFSDLATNSTGAHVHDYWGGQTTLDVLDLSEGSTWNNLGGGTWQRDFLPSDGNVVPQGTASLDISVSWGDQVPANAYGPVSLWVKPANAADLRFVKLLDHSAAETLRLPLEYNESDLPHQLISAWRFTVQYNSSGEPYNLFLGSTHMKVVANRGLPLRPFPAHPDRWHGKTRLPVIDAQGDFTNIGYTGSGNLPLHIRPGEGAIVPFDARSVGVNLTLASALPVGRLQLSYHGADNRTFNVLEDRSGAGRWTINVYPGMGDGPYVNASLWEFVLYPPPVDQQHVLDPSLYKGTYHLVVEADRDA